MNRARLATIRSLGAALAAKLEPEAQRYWQENGSQIAANLDAAFVANRFVVVQRRYHI